MTTFAVLADTEKGVDDLIFKLEKEGRWKKVREKLDAIDVAEIKAREKISKLDLINAFSGPGKAKGSKETKKDQKECQKAFHFWYHNFLPKAGHGKRNIKSDRRDVNALIKSKPAEYAETTEGFKNRMRSYIANPSSAAIKNLAIMHLSKAYPK